VSPRIGVPSRRSWVLAAALAVVAAAGPCRFREVERRDVEAWLTCMDCIQNERETVEAIGSAAVPYLSLAVYGPPPLRVANAEQLARRAWDRVDSPEIPESTFVRRSTEGFVAMYQGRAAASLGDIGTRDAIAGLRTALVHDSLTADTSATGIRYHRADVRLRILTALTLSEAMSFPGVVTPARKRFHDTVIVRSDVPGGLAGRTVQIVGAPFGNRVTVERWGDDSLAIIAGAPAGTYALQLGTAAAAGQPWAVEMSIHFFTYDVHDPLSAPEMTGAGFPRVQFPVLGGHGPADSIDYFRFMPADTVAVTVELDWVLTGELDLGWFDCPLPGDPPVQIVTPPAHTRPEVSEVRIPAGRCVLLGVISRLPDRRTHARLEINEITTDSVAARLPII